MKVEQISIFLENKFGRLSEVARLLGSAGVNIRTLTISDSSDFGILRCIVNDNEKAVRILKENGITVSKTEVVAVEVPDKPGGLAQVLSFLEQEKINVEYMYAFLEHRSDDAIIIFRFDDNDSAIHVLSAHGVKIVSGKKVYEM
jgi:hypothetical protein